WQERAPRISRLRIRVDGGRIQAEGALEADRDLRALLLALNRVWATRDRRARECSIRQRATVRRADGQAQMNVAARAIRRVVDAGEDRPAADEAVPDARVPKPPRSLRAPLKLIHDGRPDVRPPLARTFHGAPLGHENAARAELRIDGLDVVNPRWRVGIEVR